MIDMFPSLVQQFTPIVPRFGIRCAILTLVGPLQAAGRRQWAAGSEFESSYRSIM
jgi:hypothetical protein